MESLDKLLTVKDLAEYLGVPVATIYAWRSHREGPPGFRVGRHVRYRWADVERWIEDRVTQTRHSDMTQ
ncbi:MAG: helix-turn-helix domain-containing protein [Acidimicrobiia bacterium]|nr:helix-turn-helix domain-containing protein [Acidimicrobiia bacterium]